MSRQLKSEMNKKRLVIRIVLLAVVIGIGFGLYYIGKQHEILFDDQTVTIAGKEYKEIPYLNVIVDGDTENPMEFSAGDRDVATVEGPSHTFTIKVIEEDSEKVLKTVERSFNLGRTNSLVISIPAVVEGADNVYLPMPDEDEAVEEEAESEKGKESEKESEATANQAQN